MTGDYAQTGAGNVVAPTIHPQFHQNRPWLLSMLVTLVLRAGRWGESERPAAVVAMNAVGETRRLFTCASDAEASQKSIRVQHEYDELGPAAWCERYKVPIHWLSEGPTLGESWWDGPD